MDTVTVSAFHQHALSVPKSTRQVRYTNNSQFAQIFDAEFDLVSADTTGSKSPYIVFTNIDLQTFEADFFYTDEKTFYDSFEHNLQLLVVTMPLCQHEKAIKVFNMLFLKALGQMNNNDLQLDLYGSTDRKSGGRIKSPGQQYLPKVLPPGYSGDWPTVVIETGWSESKAKLARDASWWLKSGAGEVKNVLTLSVSQTRREIVMEIWDVVDRATRQDPQRKAPAVTQHIVLSQATSKSPLMITNAPLIIDFTKLFLRDPNANNREDNIVFREDTLEYYALSVWK